MSVDTAWIADSLVVFTALLAFTLLAVCTLFSHNLEKGMDFHRGEMLKTILFWLCPLAILISVPAIVATFAFADEYGSSYHHGIPQSVMAAVGFFFGVAGIGIIAEWNRLVLSRERDNPDGK